MDYIEVVKRGKGFALPDGIKFYDNKGVELSQSQLAKLATGGTHLLPVERVFPGEYDDTLFYRLPPSYSIKSGKVYETHALEALPDVEDKLLARVDGGVDVRSEHDYALQEAYALLDQIEQGGVVLENAALRSKYPFLDASVDVVTDPETGDVARSMSEAANYIVARAEAEKHRLAANRKARLAKKAAIRAAKTPAEKLAAAKA